ncbi:MAG: PAS domain S-box protein [Deltaproteobacteria bacterium]|nr:PAS domain S-box protein [Deltaproteobacteria bacterium]
MSNGTVKILLVEDNPGDARLIREMLAESQEPRFAIDLVPLLSTGLERLAEDGIDLVLLDLGLPDSRGLDTFVRAYAQAPQVPFVVLSGLNDEAVALAAVRAGAQDYLVKGQTDGIMLFRAIRYATERKKVEEDLRRANEELRQEIEVRRAAEMAVEAERQRLFALLDGLPAMVHLKATDFSIRFANRMFRKIFGDWEGKRCFEVVQGSSEPCENCPSRGVFETGTINEAEWLAPNRQTFQIYNYPFFEADGSPQVLTLGFDITRRKQAEERLRQSQIRLAEAQRIARLGHWEWDLRSGQIILSKEVYRIIGLTPEEFTPSLESILSCVHPEDKERVSQRISDTLAGVKPYNLVSRFVRPNGSVRYVHAQAEAVFDENGKPQRLLGTAQDITERRQAEMRLRASEERFRAIFEGAGLGIVLWDLEGRIMTANAAQLRMLGYREEELRGKTFLEITHPEDRARSVELFTELKTGRRDNYQLEKRFLRQDSSDFWARVTASLVRGLEGDPRYCISTVEDITARKETHEKLRESEKNLRLLASQLLTAQEDERRRISRELHDELGQALLVLKLQAKSIENELQPEQEQIRNECREMRANLDQVVDNVRRLSRDLSPTMLEDLGLSAAIHRLIRDFSRHYHIECKVQETNIDDLFPMEARVTIYRIFQECLTNIGKHSQASQLTASINKTHNHISFIIQDNGKGFNRAQRRQQGAGQGMGLAAMEERARMVGGVLSIWSQEGAGTRIAFDMPYFPKSE